MTKYYISLVITLAVLFGVGFLLGFSSGAGFYLGFIIVSVLPLVLLTFVGILTLGAKILFH